MNVPPGLGSVVRADVEVVVVEVLEVELRRAADVLPELRRASIDAGSPFANPGNGLKQIPRGNALEALPGLLCPEVAEELVVPVLLVFDGVVRVRESPLAEVGGLLRPGLPVAGEALFLRVQVRRLDVIDVFLELEV